MDMGIIRAWKSGYRRLMLRDILKEIESRIERRYMSKNTTKGSMVRVKGTTQICWMVVTYRKNHGNLLVLN